MKYNRAILISIAMCMATCVGGCAHKDKVMPSASTGAVGQNLTELKVSLSDAQKNVKDIKGNLSDIDSKIVRIQESVRNW